VLAAILDFVMLFAAGGWIVARLTGETTENGFALTGAPALVLFAVIVAYFVIGRKFVGGTVWDRILGIARPQPY
jgi:hypothetical protein